MESDMVWSEETDKQKEYTLSDPSKFRPLTFWSLKTLSMIIY
jgi:hypothetical protein